MPKPTLSSTSGTLILFLCLVALAGSGLVACNDASNPDAAATNVREVSDYPGSGLLITVDELAERIDDPDLRLIDLSEIRTYRSGHLPNATHLWWQDTMEIHNEVYGMMADPDTRAELFHDAGISDGTFVVAYDDEGGRYAARLVWLLHFVGFDDVALLDGGRQAWVAAGHALTTDSPDVQRGDIVHDPDYDVLIGADDVQAALDDPDTIIVDGRTDREREETWFGRLRVGRIPGSVHVPRDTLVQDGDVPYFDSPEQLSGLLPDDIRPGDGHTVIVYGLHGVAASQSYVGFKLLGLERVRLYDGSWAEWGADPNRPVEPLKE